jgi:hypothetical protein
VLFLLIRSRVRVHALLLILYIFGLLFVCSRSAPKCGVICILFCMRCTFESERAHLQKPPGDIVIFEILCGKQTTYFKNIYSTLFFRRKFLTLSNYKNNVLVVVIRYRDSGLLQIASKLAIESQKNIANSQIFDLKVSR